MERALIIGYGNPLRGDDGLGWRAAELLVARLRGAAEVRLCHQLTPELAEDLSRASQAVFIDASCDNDSEEIAFRQVDPDAGYCGGSSHHLTPEVLLAMARTLYGRSPEALLCTVGGACFGFGEGLSAKVQSALPALLERIEVVFEVHTTRKS